MKVFASPSRYIQGENVLFEHAKELLDLGHKPFVLCDTRVFELVGERFIAHLTRYGMRVTHVLFHGEASEKEITRILALAEEGAVDMIIGLGGGKTINSAKALADILELPIVTAPTIASTCAATSALSMLYNDEGIFERYIFYSKNPDLVLVDSKVIAKAPKGLLASGIANGLATWVATRASWQSSEPSMSGQGQSLAGLALAQQCEQILFADGLAAMKACEEQVMTPALEHVIEAAILLSGLGFESACLAAVHAIQNAFTALTGDSHDLSYGERVAYASLVQLFLEHRPVAELNRYIRFYQAIQMPTTLAELHLETASYDDLLQVGQQVSITGASIDWMPFKVSAEEIAQTISAVDQYVKNLDT